MNIPKKFDRFLSSEEQGALTRFADDKVMKEAVKKALLYVVYGHGTLLKGEPTDPMQNQFLFLLSNNPTMTDEEAGKVLKVIHEAVQLLNVAFGTITSYETEQKSNKVGGSKNQAI